MGECQETSSWDDPSVLDLEDVDGAFPHLSKAETEEEISEAVRTLSDAEGIRVDKRNHGPRHQAARPRTRKGYHSSQSCALRGPPGAYSVQAHAQLGLALPCGSGRPRRGRVRMVG